jgi:hypothetical protein
MLLSCVFTLQHMTCRPQTASGRQVIKRHAADGIATGFEDIRSIPAIYVTLTHWIGQEGETEVDYSHVTLFLATEGHARNEQFSICCKHGYVSLQCVCYSSMPDCTRLPRVPLVLGLKPQVQYACLQYTSFSCHARERELSRCSTPHVLKRK